MYPAMTEEEVAAKLNTVPVFAVTDDKVGRHRSDHRSSASARSASIGSI